MAPWLCPLPSLRRPLALAAIAGCALASSAPAVAASEIEIVRPVSAQAPAPHVSAAHDFDSFPAYLLPAHAGPAKRAPAAVPDAPAEGEPPLLIEPWTLTSVLAWPGLSPLEMEQPMRVYESDVLVKFRAPGGRSSFATVELVF